VKPVTFIGGSEEELRAFPTVARHRAGYQLYLVQMGDAPHDSKPMPSVGAGCREIFVASVRKDVYVLHCFQKKTQQTPQAALALGKRRYQQMMEIVGGKGHR
jgi:phage-related protein